MAAYVPTVWTNPVPASYPIKYKITDDGAGEIAESAVIKPVTAITPGTLLDAYRLNHMEAGLAAAQAAADAAAADADAAQVDAAAAVVAADAAAAAAGDMTIFPAGYSNLTSFTPSGAGWKDITGLSVSATTRYLIQAWLTGTARLVAPDGIGRSGIVIGIDPGINDIYGNPVRPTAILASRVTGSYTPFKTMLTVIASAGTYTVKGVVSINYGSWVLQDLNLVVWAHWSG